MLTRPRENFQISKIPDRSGDTIANVKTLEYICILLCMYTYVTNIIFKLAVYSYSSIPLLSSRSTDGKGVQRAVYDWRWTLRRGFDPVIKPVAKHGDTC